MRWRVFPTTTGLFATRPRHLAALAEVQPNAGTELPVIWRLAVCVGSKYTPLEAARLWFRARHFGMLRERREVERWEQALELPTRAW